MLFRLGLSNSLVIAQWELGTLTGSIGQVTSIQKLFYTKLENESMNQKGLKRVQVSGRVEKTIKTKGRESQEKLCKKRCSIDECMIKQIYEYPTPKFSKDEH